MYGSRSRASRYKRNAPRLGDTGVAHVTRVDARFGEPGQHWERGHGEWGSGRVSNARRVHTGLAAYHQ